MLPNIHFHLTEYDLYKYCKQKIQLKYNKYLINKKLITT